jgi:D-alanine-D-alanine ligase
MINKNLFSQQIKFQPASNGIKKSIAVIFGGRSVEHDVSIITAHMPIIQSLLLSGQYEVWPVYITKDGTWYADQAMNKLEFFQQADLADVLAKQKKVQLLFDRGLKLVWPGFGSKTVKIDVVFPSMHGTYGEDGSLMGLLRMADVPFVGCDLFASAVSMDKVLTKQILSAEGLQVVPYIWFDQADWLKNRSELMQQAEKLNWPVFVKPVHLGSSIGIAKVKNIGDLENAVEVAFHYDDKVLVEESVNNLIEVTLPIMGNDVLQLAEVERPLNRTDFFDFKDKYLSGGKKTGGANSQYSEIPAKIKPELSEQVKKIALKAYQTLGCAGTARIDFLIDSESEKIYVNEVNTLPGSLYHHNWRQAGISSLELVTRLVVLAEERFEKQQKITHVFNSEVLHKSFGPKTGA